MNQRTIKTRGKINLTLDVLGKREDGYHELEMVMQSIDLFDEMEFTLQKKGISIHCDHCQVPGNEDNIVYKAAKRLQEKYQVNKGVDITIHKRIPVAAGLAGGSTNGAGTLKALNELWQLHLSLEELMEVGKEIGADIPFCLLGGTALAKGIGEKLQPLDPLPSTWIILVKPPISISTAWAFGNLTLKEDHSMAFHTAKVIEGIQKHSIEEMVPYFYNVLEKVTIGAYPEIQQIKNRLKELGLQGVLMSGSGPTVFGFCKGYEEAQFIYHLLKKEYQEVFMVKTYNQEGDRLNG